MSNEQIVQLIQDGAENKQDLLLMLYEQNRRFIYQQVQKYVEDGKTELEDGMQEAYIAVAITAEKFDLNRGTAFITYLSFWIKSVLRRWKMDSGHTKRIPIHMQERITQYLRYRAEFRQIYGYYPSDTHVRHVLGLTEEQLEDVKQFMFEAQIVSLHDVIPGTDEGLTYADTVADPDVNVEIDAVTAADAEEDARRLWAEVDRLPEQQAEVIRHRYVDQQTIRETGQTMGISPNSVGGIEQRALLRLKRNRIVKQIGDSYGINSKAYRGSYGRWKNSGQSIVEEIVLRLGDKEC